MSRKIGIVNRSFDDTTGDGSKLTALGGKRAVKDSVRVSVPVIFINRTNNVQLVIDVVKHVLI